MNGDQFTILIFCSVIVIACFLLLGLHIDLREWWSYRNKKRHHH